MELQNYLYILAIFPFLGIFILAFSKNHQEKFIYGVVLTTLILHMSAALFYTGIWLTQSKTYLFSETLKLYQTNDTHFTLDFFFDKYTMIYGVVTSALIFLIARFSKTYMHREKGYKRFFINLLLFYWGINVIIFSGNFETLFIGWEMIGIASFFLIAYYRDRYLPIKNALKVISYYRIADIFFLLAIWGCHHAFGQSINFEQMISLKDHLPEVQHGFVFVYLVPLAFLIVAAIKSAQLPFSSWLPRAMEGPTNSSAIFYGSIAVHMGVFLMIRTYAIWQDNLPIKIVIVALGLLTTIVATMIARVQSSVKTQIAYSSIAQIGLMFVWVAFGWHLFALFHFACNAFLRSYQLLVSPSVLSYKIHDQFFNFSKPNTDLGSGLTKKIRASLYILSIKEFNLDSYMYDYMWKPFKKFGMFFTKINNKALQIGSTIVFIVGLYFAYHKADLSVTTCGYLPIVFSLIGVVMALRAFVERQDAQQAWTFVILNQLFTSLAIAFNEEFDYGQIHIFLSGVLLCGLLGYTVFYILKSKHLDLKLDGFKGYFHQYQVLATLFLIAILGIAGFPITPTFIGEDLLLGHIHDNQYVLTLITAMSIIFDGLAVYRIYARLFLGPNSSSLNEVAYRSS